MTIDDLNALLVVQEHDTAVDRLQHRRATLPERAELEARGGELRARDSEVSELRARRERVAADEERLEREVQSIEHHEKEVEQRLYSGTTSSPRELQAMQADVDMLRRQRGSLEDRELELMEEREQLEGQLAAHEASLSGLWAEVERLQNAIESAEREIDDEIAHLAAERERASSHVPEALRVDYEKRRAQNRGIGAARLEGITCQGCHLTIPSTEAERIRREAGASVNYCDNCGAILVP
jgi:hypothetical protein